MRSGAGHLKFIIQFTMRNYPSNLEVYNGKAHERGVQGANNKADSIA